MKPILCKQCRINTLLEKLKIIQQDLIFKASIGYAMTDKQWEEYIKQIRIIKEELDKLSTEKDE